MPEIQFSRLDREQPAAPFDIFGFRPMIHGFLRHGKLRAACRHHVFGPRDLEPCIPELVYGCVTRGFRARREKLVGLVVAGVLLPLLLGEVDVWGGAAKTPVTGEILVTAQAHGGEIEA